MNGGQATSQSANNINKVSQISPKPEYIQSKRRMSEFLEITATPIVEFVFIPKKRNIIPIL